MGCIYDTNPAYSSRIRLSVVTPLPLPPIAPLPDVPSTSPTDEADYEDIQLGTTVRLQSHNDHQDV